MDKSGLKTCSCAMLAGPWRIEHISLGPNCGANPLATGAAVYSAPFMLEHFGGHAGYVALAMVALLAQ